MNNSRQHIAIVGMATVFPSANHVDDLWHILEHGLNTVSKIPPHRFDVSRYVNSHNPGRAMNTTLGNFVSHPDAFDHAFFHVSPREAQSMDPQQRLLLRVSYHALENAGYVPGSTPSFDPDTFATYIGVATNDYVQNLRSNIDLYYTTGVLHAFLSGKVAYAFRFGGPSIVVDTACSSSIVAIHQACRALQSGDCNAALAGGVNVITSPDAHIGLARGHFLSESGQCRPWDASADGYCRAEGCGVFVLKRLDDALAEHDRILGVIRAVEVNQSGNAHSITHPHVPAQVALFERVVRAAGIQPHEVSVAELHGTGTQAGDPAELEAVRTVFAVDRAADNPLHITSVKVNIGHAEAAAGAASLAKLVMMMRKRTIPRHISFERLNPRIRGLDIDNVRIDTANTPWPCDGNGKRLALLTSFGAAGSNAALILEEFVPPHRGSDVLRRSGIVVGLSARSIAAAEQQRIAYIAQLESSADDQLSLEDFAYSGTARKQLHKYRVAASGSSKDEVLAGLRSAEITEVQAAQNVVLVFSGQGSQYLGMGAELYRELPLIANIVDECERQLVNWGYTSILDVFRGPQGLSQDQDEDRRFETMQTALFVLECALARLIISWGIQPIALVGHCFGEYAALVTAGVLTLNDGLRLVAMRARLVAQRCVKNNTRMSSVCASAEQLALLLQGLHGVTVCCFNNALHCTVGGTIDQLDKLDEMCATEGIQYTRLDVPYAYHTDAMDPVLDELCAIGRDICFSQPQIPIFSNVNGKLLQREEEFQFGHDYFARHCREPARFHQGISDLQTHIDLSSVAAFIELGPHPSTLSLLRNLHVKGTPLLLPTLRRNAPSFETLCATLAQLYCTSVQIDWRKVFAGLAPGARLVDLPPYPFSSTARFWVPYEEDSPRTAAAPSALHTRPRYTLLDRCVSLSSSSTSAVFETDIATVAHLIEGHRVAGARLCPASVYTELALAAASSALQEHSKWGSDSDNLLTLSDVMFPKPLVYIPERPTTLRIEVNIFEPSQKHAGSFSVASFDDREAAPRTCCSGFFRKTTDAALVRKFTYAQAAIERGIKSVTHPTPSCEGEDQRETFSTRTVYGLLFPAIVEYSAEYHAMRSATVDATSSSIYAVVQLPASATAMRAPAAGPGSYVLHPVFADALVHVAGFLVNFARGMDGRNAYVCAQVDRLCALHARVDVAVRHGVYAAVVGADEAGKGRGEVAVDVWALALDAGPRRQVVACAKRVRFRRVAVASLKKALGAAGEGADGDGKAARKEVRGSHPAEVARALSLRGGKVPALALADAQLEEVVVGIVAEVSGITRDEITPLARLSHLGIDSLMIWELVARLRALVPGGCEVDTHAFAQAATVSDLVRVVAEKVGGLPCDSLTVDSLATLCESDQEETRALTPSTGDFRQRLPELLAPPVTVAAQPAAVVSLQTVKEVFSAVLGVPVGEIADDSELESLGLDSMATIEARHVFRTRFGMKVGEEAMAILDCVTVADVFKTLCAAVQQPYVQAPLSTMTAVPALCLSSPARGIAALSRETAPVLVRLQTAPRGRAGVPPLILVHDGSGLVGPYAKLSSLGRDVWAIQNASYGTTSALADARPGNQLRVMAAIYVDMLMEALSWGGTSAEGGECFVGGWSFGGVVAYEMARLLLARGVSVKGLVLIDSPAPQMDSPLTDEVLAATSARAARNGAGQGAREHVQTQFRYATGALVGYELGEGMAGGGSLRAVFLRSKESTDVVAGCVQIDPRARAFFTRGEKSDRWTMKSWDEAVGGVRVEVLEIPGDHFAAFDEENVVELSRQLNEGMRLLSL